MRLSVEIRKRRRGSMMIRLWHPCPSPAMESKQGAQNHWAEPSTSSVKGTENMIAKIMGKYQQVTQV